MSEHIVHTAVLEDSFLIGKGLSAIPDSMRELMESCGDFAQLGCITVSGDQFSFRLLEEIAPLWMKRDSGMEAKIAFVLGWISHRACDREMKPIWREPAFKGRGSDADPALSPTECSVYHEGFMFNRYYADAPRFRLAVFPEELNRLPGADCLDLEWMTDWVEQAFAANYMEIQTIPEDLPAQTYFEEMCMRAQKFYVDPARYTRAAGNPDPELTAEYLTDINWHSEQDDIVRLAGMLRRGEAPEPGACDAAYEQTPKSHYGRALKQSIDYIMTAAEYLEHGGMEMDELKERLDIGKKGPGGLSV